MRVLDSIRRWYRGTRGGYDWHSAPGRRSSRGKQPVPPSATPVPDFSNGSDFSPGLYANLCAFDVEGLGYHVRLGQWGRSSPFEYPICSHFRLVYAFPDFSRPARALELEQVDTSEGRRNIWPYEGRQESLFALHQQLYGPGGRDQSFEHVTMRAFTPDCIAAPLTFLDFWSGPRRGYCIAQLSVADVKLQAVLSGLDQEEAVEMMRRLVPIAGNTRLIEWHDGTSRRLRAEIDRLLVGQPRQAEG